MHLAEYMVRMSNIASEMLFQVVTGWQKLQLKAEILKSKANTNFNYIFIPINKRLCYLTLQTGLLPRLELYNKSFVHKA
jgi:hypothetical protein